MTLPYLIVLIWKHLEDIIHIQNKDSSTHKQIKSVQGIMDCGIKPKVKKSPILLDL